MVSRGNDKRGFHASTKRTADEQSHAWLVALSGEHLGRRYALPPGRSEIGRSPDAAVVLDDEEASRRHALINHGQSGVCAIQDLGSHNGTYVNAERISETTILSSGDRIQIGSHILLFTRRTGMQQQLLEQQRFEAVGRTAAGAVHDFNNMIGVIISNSEYVLEAPESGTALPADIQEAVEDIRSSAHRARELTRRLLDLSRRDGGGHQQVDLSELCHETCRLLRGVIPRRIEIQCEVEPQLRLMGDYAELHHVLVNLMLNARDAIPERGLLWVGGRRTAEDSVCVRVVDDGIGMDEPTLARVFEPYFTTKERGFGLGLATAREIVQAHGGTIQVQSGQGAGTSFELVFPSRGLQPRARPMSSSPPAGRRLQRSDALVMVVDDEPEVRRSAVRILRRAGYHSVEASDGREAVKLYLESEPRPDLVLLDLDMPLLDGAETLALLRKLDPDARVLVFSGMDEGVQSKLADQGAVGALRKPVSSAELLAAVDCQVGLAQDGDPVRT